MSLASAPHLIKTCFVNITTFRNQNYEATHFYGKIHFFIDDVTPKIGDLITLFQSQLTDVLERSITRSEAKKLDFKDNGRMTTMMWDRGYHLSFRHNTIEQIKKSATEKCNAMNINVPIYLFYKDEFKEKYHGTCNIKEMLK